MRNFTATPSHYAFTDVHGGVYVFSVEGTKFHTEHYTEVRQRAIDCVAGVRPDKFEHNGRLFTAYSSGSFRETGPIDLARSEWGVTDAHIAAALEPTYAGSPYAWGKVTVNGQRYVFMADGTHRTLAPTDTITRVQRPVSEEAYKAAQEAYMEDRRKQATAEADEALRDVSPFASFVRLQHDNTHYEFWCDFTET